MHVQEVRSTDHILEPLKLDDLWVCGGCGTISKVGIENMLVLPEHEFATLDERTKRDLNFAQRAVKRNLRNQ